MRKFFPLSFKGKNFKSVLCSSLFYTLITLAFWIITSLFAYPEILGIVINLLRQFVLLYCVAGIVVSILYACDLLQKKN